MSDGAKELSEQLAKAIKPKGPAAPHHLKFLLAKLDDVIDSFFADPEKGANQALQAVIEFIRKSETKPGQALPLIWLRDERTAPAIGNQKKRHDVARDAQAAAAVSLLMEQCGFKLADACDAVSEAMGGTMTAKQLHTYRENLARRKDPTDKEKRLYFQYITEFKQMRENSPDVPDDEWRKIILAMLSTLLKKP
jgi:hypothetical protein